MKFRSLLIAALLIFVLSLGSSAMAQDMMQYCGDLSDADCEILMTASQQVPESTNFTMTLDFAVEAEGESIAFDMAASGGYVADMMALESLMFDPEMAQDPNAFFDFMESLTVESLSEMVTTLVNGADAELSITVNVPADISGGAVPESLTVDLWLVDGVGYIDLGAFSFADPSLMGIYGMDLNEIAGFAFSQITDEDLAFGMDAMFEGNPMMDDSSMDMFMDPEFLSEFMSFERLDDSEVNGDAVAVFQADLDYGALFSSEAMGEMMAEAMMEDMPEGVDEEMMMEALAEAFGDSVVTITYYVGLDNGHLYGFAFDAAFDIDAAAMAAAAGEEGVEMDPILVEMSMEFMRSNINAVESIATPDGATVIPLQDLMEGMGGS